MPTVNPRPSVQSFEGSNYHTKLSKDIFNGDTIAAASVAAHECGHAIQDKEGYLFMKIRSFVTIISLFFVANPLLDLSPSLVPQLFIHSVLSSFPFIIIGKINSKNFLRW